MRERPMPRLLTRYWKLAALWALSLVVVSVTSSRAQAPQQAVSESLLRSFLLLEGPVIVSGNDVGVRIERIKDGLPVGKVVVRIDGKWVDTAPAEPIH
jgi:hypothetical protein